MTFFNVSPFLRNYAMLGPNVGVFLETFILFGYSRQKIGSTPANVYFANSHTVYGSGGLRPGITYFLGRRFAAEATLGFAGFNVSGSRAKNNPQYPELHSNSYSFSPTWTIGSPLAVGLKYYLR